jgi:O-antigen ligase
MNQAAAPLSRVAPGGLLLMAAVAGTFAVAVGLAAGDPGSGMLLPVALVLGVLVVTGVVVRPFMGLLALAFSVFFLMIVPVSGTGRGANVFDAVLIPLALVALFGGARGDARTRDALEIGPAHDALRMASRRFGRGALLYFGLAALSLLPVALRLGMGPASTSGLSLVRAVQGALLFPLGLLWLHDWKRLDATLRAVFTAGFLFALVNVVFVLGMGIRRAGAVWTVNDFAEPIAGPNEGAAGLLVLWALLQARQAVQRSRVHVLLMGLVLLLLPLTQSRSGLLAFAAFLLLTVRHLRWRWFLGGVLVLLVALPVVPSEYWDRLAKSLMFKRGSFEVYSFLIRVYGYRAAWHVFLDNPLIGVGYVGFRFVSSSYNELHLAIGQVENFLLETMVGMGVVGLAVLGVAFERLFALGRTVLKVSPPGTLGHELGRVHAPLLIALLVANMTGATFIGLIGVGQLALWSALLVRAGHLATPRAREA